MINIDYHVELIRFPPGKVHEAVCPNEDGSYTVFLDKNDTYESQRRRLQHAMKHLGGNDFFQEDAQEIEFLAHKKDG